MRSQHAVNILNPLSSDALIKSENVNYIFSNITTYKLNFKSRILIRGRDLLNIYKRILAIRDLGKNYFVGVRQPPDRINGQNPAGYCISGKVLYLIPYKTHWV